jgi:uncharacterized Zn finger protein
LNSESDSFRPDSRFHRDVAIDVTAERSGFFLVFVDQTVSHSTSFSEEIEEISNAFPAVLDCVACGTLQPMKIDLMHCERGDRKTVVYRCNACGEVRDRKPRPRAGRGRR